MGILIADSSELIIERLTELITDALGKEAFYNATSSDEASLILEKKKPDIILLDAGLPCNGSFELMKEIMSPGIKTSVIVLSVHIDISTREKYMSFGADYFLDKFNDIDKILKVISSIRAEI